MNEDENEDQELDLFRYTEEEIDDLIKSIGVDNESSY